MAQVSPHVAAAAQSVSPPSTYHHDISRAQMQRMAEALAPAVMVGAHPEELNRRIVDKIPQGVKVVCIGEASHGTHDFYSQRAEITKLLIAERGFNAVLCEADWPDMFRVNEYVRQLSGGGGKAKNANEALDGFTRFPKWMWRNTAFAEFVEWLKGFNAARKAEVMGGSIRAAVTGAPPSAAESPASTTTTQRLKGTSIAMDTSPAGPIESGESAALKKTVGLYGMDVYSLHTSAEAVIKTLSQHNELDAAREVSLRYMCLDRYGADSQAYGMAVGMFNQPSCESAAAAALRKSWDTAEAMRDKDGAEVDEYALAIEANSMCVAGAEEYYRKMFFRSGRDTTWNLRDSHFSDTAKLVAAHLERQGQEPKLVLWAHNSHIGDARATDMSWRRNELNIGQLTREHFGKDATFNIGFTTHTGTVAASDNWDEPMKVKTVRPSMSGSIEGIMHMLGHKNCAVHVAAEPARSILKDLLLTRAIGVIYRPETERWSHYFDAYVPGQFDLLVHVDESKAVTPLDGRREQMILDTHGDMPETFPEAV